MEDDFYVNLSDMETFEHCDSENESHSDSKSESEVDTNISNDNNDDKADETENVNGFQSELTNFIV